MTNLTSFAGRWRIVSMELWDTDAIDLLEPAFIEFNQDHNGQFGFIAVRGWMDCRAATRDGRPCVEFTWEGSDEGDPVSGRGFATLTDEDTLNGRIFFHLGDDSAFQALPEKTQPAAKRSPRRRR